MDECINENYNPQREVSATSVAKPKDQVLSDKINVVNHGTKKNKGASKTKDTLASGTSYSPRMLQNDLPRIVCLCSPKKQKSSPLGKRSAGISKNA